MYHALTDMWLKHYSGQMEERNERKCNTNPFFSQICFIIISQSVLRFAENLWILGIRGGGLFILRILSIVSIGFCTYSWLRRLNFFSPNSQQSLLNANQKNKSIAADPPPPQSWKSAFFRLFTHILQYFPIKIVLKIVQDISRNIPDK